MDFVFSEEGELGGPVLRLLPAEPDDEKRTLRVLVTQSTDGAVTGSLVHYEHGDVWVCELTPGGKSLHGDAMEMLAGIRIFI